MNRKEVLMLTIYLGVVFAFEPPSRSKQYRTDYQYNRETDAFYKLHLQSKNFDDARQMCTNEGAELMDAGSQLDVMQFQQMFQNYSCYGEKAWIQHEELPIKEQLNGNCNSTSKSGNESLHDASKHAAMTTNGDIIAVFKMRKLPFICKVRAENAPFNTVCKVYGKDYEYHGKIGSCYKISNFPMSWVQAYSECQHEGSHLVILNSESEHQVIWDLVKNMTNYFGRPYLSAGFRAQRTYDRAPKVFKTVDNSKILAEAGYDKWADGEPSNQFDSEDCGSIYKADGKLNDIPCYDQDYPYICEKETPWKIDEVYDYMLLEYSNE